MRAETTVKSLDMLSPADHWIGFRKAAEERFVEEPITGKVGLDARGVLLPLGYLALLAVGVTNLFESDLSGGVLVLAAVAGAIFVRGRLLNASIWLGLVVLGLVMLAGQDIRGVLPVGAGIIGAVVAVWPDARLLRRLSSAGAEVDSEEDEPESIEPPAAVQVRSVGRVEVLVQGADLTPVLMDHRIAAFIWLYMLARLVAGGDARISRAGLADEVYPRLDTSTQKQRLRGQLRDIQHLPEALARRLRVDGELVSLELDGCDVDALSLHRLASSCRDSTILSRSLQRKVGVLLGSVGTGLFLPGWEDLEHRVTGGRSAAGAVINAARQQVSDDRADLGVVMAQTKLAAGQPAEAARLLEDALVGAPHREDVAKLLIRACLHAGLLMRAKELQAEYDLKGGA
jgi:hypothetical protein